MSGLAGLNSRGPKSSILRADTGWSCIEGIYDCYDCRILLALQTKPLKGDDIKKGNGYVKLPIARSHYFPGGA